MKTSPIKIHAALFTVALIYGANYSIAKGVMPDFIGSSGFILLRVSSAALVFWLIGLMMKADPILQLKDWIRLVACGFFGVAANMLMFFKGLSITSPVNASLIMTINPVVVMLFSALLLKEKIGSFKVIGIFLGLIGAVLQVLDPFGNSKQIETVSPIGDLLVLGNASSYAIYLVLVKPLMRKYHPITVVKYAFLFGLIMVVPFGIGEIVDAPWKSITLAIAWKLAFVVLATTVITYLLNAWTLKHVSSSVVGFYIFLQPVLATLIAVLLAGYKAGFQQIFYAALIFTGVYMVSKTKELKP